jgi:TatD DNase family protein
MLVDSHCHLDFPDFAGEIGGVMARAKEAGVGLMLTVGTQLSKAATALALAERFPEVYATVDHPRVVGIGESGLDFFYDFSPRPMQEASFRLHIAAARQLGLPLVIHSRDADDDMLRILRDEMAAGRFSALMHCFSSGRKLAEGAIDLGLYVSASGVITFNRSEDLRDIFRDLPLDRLLVETDSPYLAPVPLRGRRNEPANVAHTARTLAAVKGIGVAEIARITTRNFLRLFSRVALPEDPEKAPS